MFISNMHIKASLGLEMLLTELTNVLNSLNMCVHMLDDVGLVGVSSPTLNTFPFSFTVGKIHFTHQTHFQIVKAVIYNEKYQILPVKSCNGKGELLVYSVLCIFLSYFILLMIFPNMRIEAASRFEVSQADMTLMFDPFQMSLHMHPHVGLLPALPATPLLATDPHHTPSPEPGARVSVFVHHCV